MNVMSFILLFGGAGILMLAGDLLVRGAMGLSLRSGLSPTFVSLTVVALGTSLPELIVSVGAALGGSPDMALGNVIGSNMANSLLIVGVPALLLAIPTSGSELKRNVLIMLAATVAFAIAAWMGIIGRVTGALFLLGLVTAIVLSLRASNKSLAEQTAQSNPDDVDTETAKISFTKLTTYLAIGIVGLPIGAHGLIEGARAIAAAAGLSDSAIGLTVIALGTSLPELAASVAAAWRGRTDMVMGNVIGSNLMNILAIVGITALITPLAVAPILVKLDITMLLGVSVILTLIVMAKWKIGRGIAAMLLFGYAAFTWLALTHVAG